MGGRFSVIFWQTFNILFWHRAELMTRLLAFHYSTPPKKNFHGGCNLSCYPRGQARPSTGLATAVNRALLSVKLKATVHKVLGKSIGGGPRHEHEDAWIRPARSGFCMQNMKTGLRPWFCVPIQQTEPRPCRLCTQLLLCRGNRWVKESVKIMHNPKLVALDGSNSTLQFRKKANKFLHRIQLQALTSTAVRDCKSTC